MQIPRCARDDMFWSGGATGAKARSCSKGAGRRPAVQKTKSEEPLQNSDGKELAGNAPRKVYVLARYLYPPLAGWANFWSRPGGGRDAHTAPTALFGRGGIGNSEEI